MSIFSPFLWNRHPEISCWNCMHVTRLVPLDPIPQDPDLNYLAPRGVQCRRVQSLNLSYEEMFDWWEEIWEIDDTSSVTADDWEWPTMPDGSLTWCSAWRQMTGTPPTLPPEVNGNGGG